MRSPLLSHNELEKQIKLLGRYAILSHRWDEGQELSFTDNLLDPSVQQKTGFHKLCNFTVVVKTQYGCRYLWMDTMHRRRGPREGDTAHVRVVPPRMRVRRVPDGTPFDTRGPMVHEGVDTAVFPRRAPDQSVLVQISNQLRPSGSAVGR